LDNYDFAALLTNLIIERCAREIEELVALRVPASEYAGYLRELKIGGVEETTDKYDKYTVKL
jgi:hypothetical protein